MSAFAFWHSNMNFCMLCNVNFCGVIHDYLFAINMILYSVDLLPTPTTTLLKSLLAGRVFMSLSLYLMAEPSAVTHILLTPNTPPSILTRAMESSADKHCPAERPDTSLITKLMSQRVLRLLDSLEVKKGTCQSMLQ